MANLPISPGNPGCRSDGLSQKNRDTHLWYPLSPYIRTLFLLVLFTSLLCGSAMAGQNWTTQGSLLNTEDIKDGLEGANSSPTALSPDSAANLSTSISDALDPHSEEKILIASDRRRGDRLGYWHSISVCGDVAVAGAMGADSPGLTNNGQAYIFERNAGGPNNWGQAKVLTASDAANNASFGYSTSVSGDTIIVGAYKASSPGMAQNGQVYVFERNAGGPDNWGQVKILSAPDAEERDHLGTSICISGDTIVAGALRQYPLPLSKNGQVYVFERNAGGQGNWSHVKTLTGNDQTKSGTFGISTSVSGDTIVVGERTNDQVYIFYRDTGGSDNWGQAKVLTSPDTTNGISFGHDVSVSGDIIVAGAPSADNGGRAYIFERDAGGPDTWEKVAVLTAPDSTHYGEFGNSVSVSGNKVVVGDTGASSGGYQWNGLAYAFQKGPGSPGTWSMAGILSASDKVNRSGFGWAVALSGDTVVVGAPDAGSEEYVSSGQAYVFGPALSPSFTASPTTGTAPLAVTFSDTSGGRITGWLWDFGDGTTSTDKDPLHTYTIPGSYRVNLTVTGPGGTKILEKPGYISVRSPGIYADFTVSPVGGTAPLMVKCTDKSIGSPTRYNYNFGDGVTIQGPNPGHTYKYPGTYNITLTVTKYDRTTNSLISSSTTRTNVITVSKIPFVMPVAKFTATPVNGPAPLTVTFTDLSTGDPTLSTIIISVTGSVWRDQTLPISTARPECIMSH